MESSLDTGTQQARFRRDSGTSERSSTGSPADGRNLTEILEGLEGATQSFNEMLDAVARRSKGNAVDSAIRIRRATPTGRRKPRSKPKKAQPPVDPTPARLAAAEIEAQAYLDAARTRAERLVRSILQGVEIEAERIQREAFETAELRLRAADREAISIVKRRQRHISELTDGICFRAERLASQIEGAEKVRQQFLKLAESLSITADQIAADQLNPKT